MPNESLSNSTLLLAAVFSVFAISSVLIVVAVLSAKSMGGRLGMGLKKIAAGAIIHAALFFLILLFQNGWGTILKPSQVQILYVSISIVGSGFLIAGFYEIYKISKELKLFY